MKYFLRLIPLWVLLSLAGCSDTSPIIQYSPTRGPIAFPTPTGVAASVELGTGLSGSGQNVSIVDPTSSFGPYDALAFVIHLRGPIDATQMTVIIYDSNGNVVADWVWSVQQTDTILFGASPSPLGALFQSFHNSNLPTGSYKLVVFPSSSSMLNYANDITFTYTP